MLTRRWPAPALIPPRYRAWRLLEFHEVPGPVEGIRRSRFFAARRVACALEVVAARAAVAVFVHLRVAVLGLARAAIAGIRVGCAAVGRVRPTIRGAVDPRIGSRAAVTDQIAVRCVDDRAAGAQQNDAENVECARHGSLT